MAESKEKLFDQFPPVSTQEWKEKVVADLKGVRPILFPVNIPTCGELVPTTIGWFVRISR